MTGSPVPDHVSVEPGNAVTSRRAIVEPRSLDRLLHPRSIAVVGVTERSSFASQIVENLVRFRGPEGVYPVNPRHERVQGLRCYGTVEDLPASPDLVMIGVTAERIPMVLAQCERRAVGGVQVISAGFAETPDGAALQAGLVEWSRRSGIPLAGPNCLGLLHAPSGVMAMTAPLERLVPGAVGVVTQSGGFGSMLASLLFARGIGITSVITGGNEAALDLVDYLSYLVDDPATRVIGCFVEQIRRPQQFIEACRSAADRRKPVVMLKIGRSEVARRAALSHTGSLTGSDTVVDAVLGKLGVARVMNVDEMVETLAVFHQSRPPRGSGVATVHLSGGIATLTSDNAATAGLHMPELPPETIERLRGVVKGYGTVGNPLDLTGQVAFEAGVLRDALAALAGSPGIDVVIFGNNVALPMRAGAPIAVALQDAVAAHPDVRFFVLAAANGRHVHRVRGEADRLMERLDEVPLLQGSEYGLRAVGALIKYAEFQRARSVSDRPSRRASTQAASTAREMLGSPRDGLVLEHEAKLLLAAYGIEITREEVAATPQAAVAAAEAIGFPVVLKVVSTSVPHKTDVGGVLLDLRSADSVREGFATISESVRRSVPSARIDGMLVAEMVRDGVEMIIGISRDPQFGLTVTCGLGGVLVAVLRDSQVLVPPLSERECRAALRRLRGYAVLEGARGEAPADLDAAVDVLLRISDLCGDVGELIDEVDINPLVVRRRGEGAFAVDCLVSLQGTRPSSAARSEPGARSTPREP